MLAHIGARQRELARLIFSLDLQAKNAAREAAGGGVDVEIQDQIGQAAAVQGHMRLLVEAIAEVVTPRGLSRGPFCRSTVRVARGRPSALPRAERDPVEQTAASGVQYRLSEVIGALSHALDLTEGQPVGHSQRSCMIGMALAERLDLGSEVRARSLLRDPAQGRRLLEQRRPHVRAVLTPTTAT